MALQERPNAVMTKGGPRTLLGPALKPGDKAPAFTVTDNDFKPVSLSDFKGKTKILVSIFSVETPVCDTEMKRFNEEAAKLGDVAILILSMDLPFSQKRYCGAAGMDKVKVLSDYKDHSFSTAYGVFIKENRLTSRAVFVVDANDTVTYAQYVPELGQQPDFDALLNSVKQTVKA